MTTNLTRVFKNIQRLMYMKVLCKLEKLCEKTKNVSAFQSDREA